MKNPPSICSIPMFDWIETEATSPQMKIKYILMKVSRLLSRTGGASPFIGFPSRNILRSDERRRGLFFCCPFFIFFVGLNNFLDKLVPYDIPL